MSLLSWLVCFALCSTAQAATINVSVDTASPTVDSDVSLTISGTVEQDGFLTTYEELNGKDCAPNDGAHSARSATYSMGLHFPKAGAFSFNERFTPLKSGPTRICAYLYYDTDDEDQQPPRALGQTTVEVTEPPGTLAVTSSNASPRASEVVTLTFAGDAGRSGSVWAYSEVGGADCAPIEGDQGSRLNSRFIDGRSVGKGPYSLQMQFSPSQATSYRICSYLYYDVSDMDTKPPAALSTIVITATPPPPPPDRDADGKPDSSDVCPDAASTQTNGCPLPSPDRDADGVPDATDKCATIKGNPADGCPTATNPKVTVGKQSLKKRALTLQASCAYACALSLKGTVLGKRMPSRSVKGGTTRATLKVTLSRSDVAKMTKALKGRTRTVSVSVVATYSNGVKRTTKVSVRLSA